MMADPIKLAIQSSLAAYAVARDEGFVVLEHHRKIFRAIDRLLNGEGRQGLIVNMPPRHGKSEICSRLLPAHYLGNNPKKEVIFATYGQSLADKFGRYVRNQLKEKLFNQVFQECTLAEDSSSVKAFNTHQGGQYIAVGVGGAMTGMGFDLGIVDDPHKDRQEANSEVYRQKTKEWFQSVFMTRRSPTAKIIVIQTRWHEDDLSGWLLREYPEDWDVLQLPALDEQGKALWPERFSTEALLSTKKQIGSYEFEALYQQNPTPAEGGIVKREWIKYYKVLPSEMSEYTWAWDTAIKPGQENDYSVGQLWAKGPDGYYLIENIRERMEYPELKRLVEQCYNKRPGQVLIEDKSSGQQLVQEFKRNSRMPVIGISPGREIPLTKHERLAFASPLFESGRIFVPGKASWAMDYIQELCSFPNAAHDDQVDASTLYLCKVQAYKRAKVVQL